MSGRGDLRMRTRFPPDRGLATRMVVTVFLLGALYAVFGGLLVALLKSAALAVVIVGAVLFAQFWFSDRIALRAIGGREVTSVEEPELHAVIDRLCALADMPKPRVAVAETDLPNAFATGRSPARAVVCVTTGLTRRLEGEELQAVLAHELSHVAHRDVVVMTVASFLGVLAGLIARVGLYSGLYGESGRRRDDDNSALVIVAVVAVSVVVYAVSFLLTRALSRYRELAADRAGVILTGRPSALGSALTKISGDIARIPTRDLREVQALNAFFFAPAMVTGTIGSAFSTLLSTHPPLEQRLEQLAELSRDFGQEG